VSSTTRQPRNSSSSSSSSSSDVASSVGTDDNWLATTTSNPIRYSHLFHGEIFDARLALQQKGWDRANFQATTGWHAVSAYRLRNISTLIRTAVG
jgi:hypothetical protein